MTPYEVLPELGEGGFGLVVLARLKATENVSITRPSDTDRMLTFLHSSWPSRRLLSRVIARCWSYLASRSGSYVA